MSSLRPVAAAPRLIALACALALAACAVGPNFVRPTAGTPAHWVAQSISPPAAPAPLQSSPAVPPAPSGPPGPPVTPAMSIRQSMLSEQPAQLSVWWTEFQDPVLNSLVQRALSANLDLRGAVLRVAEARSQREITAAGLWPALSANASYTRARLSETTPTGALFSNAGAIHLPGGGGVNIPNPYNQYQLGASASWEIDLFGRLRRGVEAADANVQVSVEDQHAVRLSLLGELAQSYLELRGAQARKALTIENLATIDELLELTRQRRAAGLTSDLDVSNAMAQESVTRALLPALDLQITQDIHQLSQLLAREPEALRPELDAATPLPVVPPQVPVGLPAELARRRPDIRQAEASLHAATAQIGVAVADLFPRLTLAASGGFQSETLGQLIEWASRFGTIGPTLDLPIFDRGRWQSVHLENLRAQEAALTYQRMVLNALYEVENALAAYGADQDQRAWLDSAVAQNRDALTLARQRYASGVAAFIDVLDAERTLQENELALLASTTAVATDLVRLYRALGGGWQDEQKDGQKGTDGG